MDMAVAGKMMSENPDMAKQGMEEWGMWMTKNAAHFADPGAPVGKNTEVSASGAIQKSNDVAGYSVINAESMEAVTALLADNPHFKMPGATADVMELMAMPM